MNLVKGALIRGSFGFLAVNMFFVAPLAFVATSNTPPAVEVHYTTPSRTSIKVGVVRECGESGANQDWKRAKVVNATAKEASISIFLPCNTDLQKLCVCSSDGANIKVRKVESRTRFIIRHEYSEPALECSGVYSCTRTGNWSLHISSSVKKGMAVFELAMLLLAFLIGGLMCHRRFYIRENLWNAVCVSAMISLLFVVVLPIQSYLSNTSLYSFTLVDLVAESLLPCLVAFVIMGVGLFVSAWSFGNIIYVFLIAIAVYEYLHTGILALGEPPINGEVVYWLNPALELRDIIVVASIAVVFTLGYYWIRCYVSWIAAAIILLSFASLLDVKKDYRMTDESTIKSEGFCSKQDVAKYMKHSAKRNVIVLVVDAIGTRASLDVLAEDPSLASEFTGFTAFTNNIAAHNQTQSSTVTFTCGRLFEKNMSEAEQNGYWILPASTNSIWHSFVRQGATVSFIPGSLMFGYSSFYAGRNDDISQGRKGSCYGFRPETVPSLSLFELVRFRVMPFTLKFNTLMMTLVGAETYASVGDEDTLYPYLGNAEVSSQIENNFELFHTQGAHSPFDLDRHGNKKEAMDMGYHAYLEKAYYALHKVAELLRRYKEMGIYDNSMIVVMADHGWFDSSSTNDETLFFDRAKPMLWVKPIFASNIPLMVCESPTWLLKVRDMLHASVDNNLSIEDIIRILRAEKRIYRVIPDYNPLNYKDYYFDDDGSVMLTQ